MSSCFWRLRAGRIQFQIVCIFRNYFTEMIWLDISKYICMKFSFSSSKFFQYSHLLIYLKNWKIYVESCLNFNCTFILNFRGYRKLKKSQMAAPFRYIRGPYYKYFTNLGHYARLFSTKLLFVFFVENQHGLFPLKRWHLQVRSQLNMSFGWPCTLISMLFPSACFWSISIFFEPIYNSIFGVENSKFRLILSIFFRWLWSKVHISNWGSDSFKHSTNHGSFESPHCVVNDKSNVVQNSEWQIRFTKMPLLRPDLKFRIYMIRILTCLIFFPPHSESHSLNQSFWGKWSIRLILFYLISQNFLIITFHKKCNALLNYKDFSNFFNIQQSWND